MRLEKKYFHWAVLIFSLCCISQVVLFGQDNTDKEKEERTEKLFQMSLEELLNVKITTADRSSQRIMDIPASVVLITREDIETFGYTTLAEILENIPGLYGIDDYGDSGMNFGVRGFWSGLPNRNMIIQVDGVPQTNYINFCYTLSGIPVPVESIDRIEIIRGPMSVIYGNGAFYGVINIITNDSAVNIPNITSVSVGSLKSTKLFLKLSDQGDDFRYNINASTYKTDGFNHNLSDLTTDPAILQDTNNKTGGRLGSTERYFNFSGSFKDLYINLSYNEDKKGFFFTYPSYPPGTYLKNSNVHLSGGYRKKVSETFTIDGRLSYGKNRDWYRYRLFSKDFYGMQNMEANAVEFTLDTFYEPTAQLEVTSGLYYRSILEASNMYDLPSFGYPSLENNVFSLPDNNYIITQAFYSQATYTLSKSLCVIGGLRFEQSPQYYLNRTRTVGNQPAFIQEELYDQSKIEIIPRLAVIFSPKPETAFKFLYGKAINRPSFDQNRQNVLAVPRLDDLKPEHIQTFELNFIGMITPRLTINASIFKNILNNLITRVVVFDEDMNYKTWSVNAQKMVTHGMELSFNSEPINHLRLDLSGSYQETKDKREAYKDITVAYSPKFLGYIKASYTANNFSIGLTGNYVGKMETYWDETIKNPDDTFGNRIGKTVDGHFAFSANLRLNDIILDGLFLNVKCYNLFDKDIYYPTFTNNQWADKGTLGLGRIFLISLGYKF